MEISLSAIESQWEEAFGDARRPGLYASSTPDEEGFLPLNDPQDFVTDITHMSNQQLQASGANNQFALKVAQDEFTMISKLIVDLNGKDSFKDPQAMKLSETFEEIKESQLYGYKYDRNKPALYNRGPDEDHITEKEKEDVRLYQEPFEQGGFVPTKPQYKSIMSNARDPSNPDGWIPVEWDGRQWIPAARNGKIPKQQIHHDEYPKNTKAYFTRSEKDTIRPSTATSMESELTPSKPANRQLARTRFGGQKFPPTRDASEEPSGLSTPRGRRPNTPKLNGHSVLGRNRPDDSPATKRRRTNHSGPQLRQSQSLFRPPRTSNNTTGATTTPLQYSVGPEFPGQPMSPTSLRKRKWTTEELVEAVKYDHTWLTDDPAQSEHWKEKILGSQYPVRTFSMFKKWSYWKQENRDKRPRNRKDGGGEGKAGKAGKAKSVSAGAASKEEETKDELDQALGEMMAENRDEKMDDKIGYSPELAASSPTGPQEEHGLGIEGMSLRSEDQDEVVEDEVEIRLDKAAAQQIGGEVQLSVEEADEVKEEEHPDSDTIVAMTDSRPITPMAAPSPALRVTRRSMRASGRIG